MGEFFKVKRSYNCMVFTRYSVLGRALMTLETVQFILFELVDLNHRIKYTYII